MIDGENMSLKLTSIILVLTLGGCTIAVSILPPGSHIETGVTPTQEGGGAIPTSTQTLRPPEKRSVR